MAFESSLLILRNLIDDTASIEYTDARLLELIYVSSVYVNLELGSEYTINISLQTITPEPDTVFETMVALKAACLLTRSTQSSYAKNDFTVTDGPSTVSLKGAADKLKVVSDDFCSQYERAKLGYLMGSVNGGGYAITTPSSAS